jgi:hypothetical protein
VEEKEEQADEFYFQNVITACNVTVKLARLQGIGLFRI